MVHRSCLEHWLTASNTSHCELCRFEFAMERLPKPLSEVKEVGKQLQCDRLYVLNVIGLGIICDGELDVGSLGILRCPVLFSLLFTGASIIMSPKTKRHS